MCPLILLNFWKQYSVSVLTISLLELCCLILLHPAIFWKQSFQFRAIDSLTSWITFLLNHSDCRGLFPFRVPYTASRILPKYGVAPRQLNDLEFSHFYCTFEHGGAICILQCLLSAMSLMYLWWLEGCTSLEKRLASDVHLLSCLMPHVADVCSCPVIVLHIR